MSAQSKMPPKAAGRPNNFQTVHRWPAQAILKYVPMDYTIWDPASGEGIMSGFMMYEGYNVIETDIINGFDFLEPMATVQFGYDCIITNGPYDEKDKWLARCFETGKPFALMLPISALGEQERFKLYKKYGIQVLLLPERVVFKTPSGKIGGAWFYVAWFTMGLNLPRDITCSDIIVPPEAKVKTDLEPQDPRCKSTIEMFGEAG